MPDGKKHGSWWKARVPWREDKNPSLGVDLRKGRWQDFSQGTHGDLTDLLSRIDHCTPAEAATRLAQMMGVR